MIFSSTINRWYPLKSKPGQEGKNKLRGEIEVRVAFTVKSGSLLDLSKKEKHKGSFGHVTQAAHNIGRCLKRNPDRMIPFYSDHGSSGREIIKVK